jgi:hypothetical protein
MQCFGKGLTAHCITSATESAPSSASFCVPAVTCGVRPASYAQGRRRPAPDGQVRPVALVGDPDGSGQAPRTTTSGHIDITGIAEAAVLAGPGNLTGTILKWHRQLIVQKWTYANKRPGRHGVLAEIRRLVVRMQKGIPPGATRGSRAPSGMWGIA